MEDSHRIFEQRALRNVRGLLDRLERDSLGRRRRERRLILLAIAPLAVLIAVSAFNVKPVSAPIRSAQACEMDTWIAKESDFVRKVQEANPEMPYREVREQLKRNQPALMAAARTQCAAQPRP